MVHERVEEIKEVQERVIQHVSDLPENGTVKVKAHVVGSGPETKVEIISKRIISKRIKGSVESFDFSEKQ